MRIKFSTPQWVILIGLFVINTLVLVTLASVIISGSRNNQFAAADEPAPTQEQNENSESESITKPDPLQPTATTKDSPPGTSNTPPTSTQPAVAQPPNEEITTTPADNQTWVEQTLAKMTLEEKIGQLMIISLQDQQEVLTDCRLIEQVRPAGMFLHPQNVVDFEQVRSLTEAFQSCARELKLAPLLIAIDHEGEYVQRFDDDATTFPAALGMGATGDLLLMYNTSKAAGEELAYGGINMILGPVADVLTNYDNKVVSQRTFGGDPQEVARFVIQAVRGYSDSGLIPVIKHFPGHGNVSDDSHKTLPIDESNLEALESTHLPPFRAGLSVGAPVVMLSHVAYPAISDDQIPASLSPDIIAYLREELLFDGVVLTDAMDMKAVTGKKYQVAQASLEAINAGVDLLLITSPKQAQSTHAKLVEAVTANTLSMERVDQSVRRVLMLKAQNGLMAYPTLNENMPDLEQHDQLAITAGEKSVTLFKDRDDLVPLPEEIEKILIVGPVVPDWFFYTGLVDTLQKIEVQVDFLDYPPPWDGLIPANDTQEELKQMTPDYDLVIALTWQSHINHILYDDPWQIELVNGLIDSGIPLIVVAMKSPTDIIDFSTVGTYLGTYGTNEGAMNFLIDVLVGSAKPTGKNPLPDLPLE